VDHERAFGDVFGLSGGGMPCWRRHGHAPSEVAQAGGEVGDVCRDAADPRLEHLQDVRPADHHQKAPRPEASARSVFAMILQSSFSDQELT
jgi:hypothetical protein